MENHSRPYLFRWIDLGEDDSVSGVCVLCVHVCVGNKSRGGVEALIPIIKKLG